VDSDLALQQSRCEGPRERGRCRGEGAASPPRLPTLSLLQVRHGEHYPTLPCPALRVSLTPFPVAVLVADPRGAEPLRPQGGLNSLALVNSSIKHVNNVGAISVNNVGAISNTRCNMIASRQ
jgi:hypothetical protein